MNHNSGYNTNTILDLYHIYIYWLMMVNDG
jgi:hypothetical protein